jgi:hypothetical protein
MMKKLTTIVSLGMLLLVCGCGSKSPWAPSAGPADLTIASSGLDITLDWTAVTGAEGYYVYFDDAVIDTVTTCTWTGTPTTLGDFYVIAYKGSDNSPASPTVTTSLVTATGKTIYELNSLGISGCGWDTLGVFSTYSMAGADTATKIDIYLDNFTAGDTTSACSIVAASNKTGWRNTAIDGPLASDVTTAAATGYANYQAADTKWYTLSTDDTRFVKIQVTTVGTGYITFTYWYQTVKNYRKVG